ncbi:S8 family serine peptidase [Streptosporangium carneum]|uniref:RCC1 domain-containing protein n=1 Tax=Streptosporangium carneum TaxID=47481 RepID=UPI0022F302BB|nr:S8 family serine peptidase [Streptosporangium carneum]
MAVGALSGMVSAGTAWAEPAQAYDHSKDKGKAPGTHGPLPKGFSTTQLSVKFKADREVRLRDRKLVAENSADASEVQRVLAKYKGASIRPLSSTPETKVTQQRLQLEKRVGRELPDLNSWFVVTVPKGIESLLSDLNALPSVEIAQAKPILTSPTEPLSSHQKYRNAANSVQGGGVDADYANAQPGGKGDGITVTDIEVQSVVTPLYGQQTVAAGDDHSLLVSWAPTFGQVWSWGDNAQGQLGLGHTTTKKVPVAVPGLTGVTAVSAGNAFSVAMKNDGTVWAWGDNSQGQLGNGTLTDSSVPVQVAGIYNAVGVSAGAGHALAVLADGTVRAWGDNSQGQLGYAGTDSPVAIAVPGLTGVSATLGTVAAGTAHSVAVLSTGTVKAWGDNSQGQLGDGTTTDRISPVAVSGLTGVSQVSSRADHVLALISGGTVKAWGDNAQGQLGDGTTTDRKTPVAVSGLTNVSSVSAGSLHSVAATLSATSDTYTWGDNAQGQLGNGTTTDSTTPIAISANSETIAAGLAHNVTKLGQWLYVWGANGSGRLGDGTTTGRTSPVELLGVLNSWNLCHEDLAGRVAAGEVVQVPPMFGDPCSNDSSVHHGTGVAGVIGAQDDNGVGIAGIAPNATLHLSGTAVPDAVAYATAHSSPGDVILYEVAIVTSSGWYPWEVDSSVYDQTVLAVAAGVTVVEPAGNGGNDLDDSSDTYATTIMGRPDSGAIMVGAGSPPSPGGTNCTGSSPAPERSALSFSTYGLRVNVQAYGACVATLGAPGWQELTPSETNPNKLYAGTFNGTSSAGAIVAGVVADLQGVAKNAGAVLTPVEVNDTLRSTGTGQHIADLHHIGPHPNLHAAIDEILAP